MLLKHRANLAVLACLLVPSYATAQGPYTPQLLWTHPTDSHLVLAILSDAKRRSFVYAAQKTGGVLVLEEQPGSRAVKAAAQVPVSELQGLHAVNLAQQGNLLFVALGDFFAAKGSRAGIAVLDVSNPSSARVLHIWTSSQIVRGAAGVLVDGKDVYLAAMDAGVLIFKLKNNALRKVSQIVPDIHFPTPNPNRIRHPNARALALHGDLLYVSNDAGGLRVIDVSKKNKPREIGRYINPELKNKPQAYNGVVLDWPLAYVAVDYCGLEVLDVRNPKEIERVGWWNPWGCEKSTNIWFNSAGHTNQIAFDPAQKLVYLSAGDSELKVIDVGNPRKPFVAGGFGKPKNKQGAWGVSISRDKVYLGYIRTFVPFRGTWSGIKALLR